MWRIVKLAILCAACLLWAEPTPAQQRGTRAPQSAAQQSVAPPLVRFGGVLNKQGKALAGFVVEWKQGRLTVDAEKALLSRVLHEVAAQTGIRFLGLDELHRQISVHFSNVPLSAGLEMLLAHTDYAMRGDPGDPSTMRIILFEQPPASPERAAGTAAPAARDKESEAMAAEESAMMDRMPPAQEETVQAETAPTGGGKDGPQPQIHAGQLVDPTSDLSVLAQALGERDPAVKEAAIQALAQSEGPQAMDLLRQAFRDSDSAVKMMVIENVGSTPDAVPLLLEASQDSEESVREAAQLWLDLEANQP